MLQKNSYNFFANDAAMFLNLKKEILPSFDLWYESFLYNIKHSEA